ncbi:unnamed protein product [Strongylus vulgaris]|uniref:Uncharacterized protein n=1 Tax=Strongylus vulgaris TaxID=40348 RepID=A0A3P7I997_STRVU|nr:unnamed protein product [Strongylus vulgaris]
MELCCILVAFSAVVNLMRRFKPSIDRLVDETRTAEGKLSALQESQHTIVEIVATKLNELLKSLAVLYTDIMLIAEISYAVRRINTQMLERPFRWKGAGSYY